MNIGNKRSGITNKTIGASKVTNFSFLCELPQHGYCSFAEYSMGWAQSYFVDVDMTLVQWSKSMTVPSTLLLLYHSLLQQKFNIPNFAKNAIH